MATSAQEKAVSSPLAQQQGPCDGGGMDCFDFGDAPLPYPTLLKNNGAHHEPSPEVPLHLGTMQPDPEPDGQPHGLAQGDDAAGGPDDEDGVWFPAPLVPGQMGSVEVSVTGPGFLNGWVDFNSDGDWSDFGEQIISDAVTGTGTYNFLVPSGAAQTTMTYARFRLSNVAGVSYDNAAQQVIPYGEVEDETVEIAQDPNAMLEITKSADPPSAVPDLEVVYTLKVKNMSGDSVTDLTLLDAIPVELEFRELVSYTNNGNSSPGPTCNAPSPGSMGGSLRCVWHGTTPDGTEETVVFRATVRLTPPGGDVGVIVNNALTFANEHPTPVEVAHRLPVYTRCNVDLMFAVDRSFSQTTSVLDRAKAEATVFVNTILAPRMPSSQAGVIYFNTNAFQSLGIDNQCRRSGYCNWCNPGT